MAQPSLLLDATPDAGRLDRRWSWWTCGSGARATGCRCSLDQPPAERQAVERSSRPSAEPGLPTPADGPPPRKRRPALPTDRVVHFRRAPLRCQATHWSDSMRRDFVPAREVRSHVLMPPVKLRQSRPGAAARTDYTERRAAPGSRRSRCPHSLDATQGGPVVVRSVAQSPIFAIPSHGAGAPVPSRDPVSRTFSPWGVANSRTVDWPTPRAPGYRRINQFRVP